MKHLLLLPLLATLFLVSCADTVVDQWLQQGGNWALVHVELDRSRLAQRGRLPVFRNPGEEAFGRAPMAKGSLGVSRDGRVVCEVVFNEQAPRGSYTYEAVNFVGILGKDHSRVDSAASQDHHVAQGATTVLMLKGLRNGHLLVHTASGETLLPYTYEFAPPPARMQPIPMPTIDD